MRFHPRGPLLPFDVGRSRLNVRRSPRRVNLILFDSTELAAPLSRRDARAVHILDVLRRRVGDVFDAGVVDGARGKGTLVEIGSDALRLAFAWEATPPPLLEPITLIVGLPRPQTARKVLHAATELGAAAVHFVTTEKGEPSYASSTLWSSGEWRRHLIEAAQQAFTTRLPAVTLGRPLAEVLAAMNGATATSAAAAEEKEQRIALDNYEATGALGTYPIFGDADARVCLAFGAERGWSGAERELLRAQGFALAHLGARVLRVETAVLAALAIVRARRGGM